MWLDTFLNWFSGGSTHPYMPLYDCMARDHLWIAITIALDLAVAAGYMLIAYHWWVNQKRLEPSNPARIALANMRNIFLFCGICGYLFIPIKIFWPAWRLYDLFLFALVYFTWRYAWRARDLKVVFNELGRTKQLAEDLEQTRIEAKRRSFFLNSVSHDLRTPLNGLMLQAAVAEMGVAQNDPELIKESVAQMKSTAKVAADLLTSLLEVGRMDWAVEQKNVTEFALDDVLADSAKRSAPELAQKGLTFNPPQSTGVRVLTDRLKLARIVDNLLSNAIKFTDRGSVSLLATVQGKRVMVQVADTGHGIAAENVQKLFDEFYQVKNVERNHTKGFGLGLAIARRLAEQLGGKITVESQLDRGSQFTVTFDNILAKPGRPKPRD